MIVSISIINNMEITKETLRRLRAIRKEKGLSSDKLGELVGLSGSAIRNIEAGRRKIKLETLEKIAQALGVSVSELLTSPKEKKNIEVEKREDLVMLPVIAGVPAGGFKGGDVEIIDYLPTPKEMLQGVPQQFTAWVRVVGDSMEPKVKNGDMILVADGSYVSINNGDLVVAIIDGERTLKRFYDKGNYIVLQPENKNYEPIVVSKEELKEKPMYLYKVLWIAYRP